MDSFKQALELFNVSDVVREGQEIGMQTLSVHDERPIKKFFIDQVENTSVPACHVKWAIGCLYVISQYLLYMKHEKKEALDFDSTVVLKEYIPELLSAVVQSSPSEDDKDLLAAFQMQSPLYVLIYSLFLDKGREKSAVFDDVHGNIAYSSKHTCSQSGAGMTKTINVCIMTATIARFIKSKCVSSTSCSQIETEFRRMMAIALTGICQDTSQDMAESFKNIASKVVLKNGIMQWIESSIFGDTTTATFIDKLPNVPDYVKYFIHSIVNLREAYINFGNTCNSITSQDRQEIQDMINKSLEIGRKFAETFDRGNDDRERHQKQKRILIASVVNIHYTIKVFMTLPWIAQVFSIDNIPALLARAIDPRGDRDPKTIERIQELQRSWRRIFFVEVPTKLKNMMLQTLNGYKDSIQKEITQDTGYVKNVIRVPGEESSDTEYMSRFNMHRHLTLMLFNSLNNMEGADNPITEFALEYVKSFVLMYNQMNSNTEGINGFKNLEATALTTRSKSKSTVLSYVRIRANGNMYQYRHDFLLNPMNMDTQFYIRYNSRYELTPEQNNAKDSIISRHSTSSSNDRALTTEHAYAFGPFTRVFYPNHSNREIASSSYEVIHSLLHGKSVMVMGFGISGAGKTSTLIYLKPAYGEPQRGVVLHWITALQAQGYFQDGIKYRAVEYYGKGDTIDKWQLRNMNVQKSILEAQDKDDVNINMDPKADDDASWRMLENKDVNMINRLGEELVKLVTDPAFRQTKPTTNNDSSSRSHVVFTIQVSKKTYNDHQRCYLHIVDLAGVENAFDKSSDTVVSGFMDPKRQSCQIAVQYLSKFKELNVARGTPSPPGTSDDVVNCTVFERYLFQDSMPFIDNQEEKDKMSNGFIHAGRNLRDWYISSATSSDGGVPMYVTLNIINAFAKSKNVVYASSQLWDSVIMNCYAKYNINAVGNIELSVAEDRTVGEIVRLRAKLALNSGSLFPLALGKIVNKEQNKPYMTIPYKDIPWAEPIKFLPKSTKDSEWHGLLSIGQYTMKSDGFEKKDFIGKLPKVITSKELLKADSWPNGQFLHDLAKKRSDEQPKQFSTRIAKEVRNNKDVWIAPRDKKPPPIYTLGYPPRVFKDLSMLEIANLKRITSHIMDEYQTLSTDDMAKYIIDVLTMFKGTLGNESDSFLVQAMTDVNQIKRVLHNLFGDLGEATNDAQEALKDVTDEPVSDITTNLRNFFKFFTGTQGQTIANGVNEPQQRLFAYIQMMYAFIKETLELNSVGALTQIIKPTTETAIIKGYETECKLRAAIPLSMFILRNTESYDKYIALSHPWTSDELMRIVDIPSVQEVTSGKTAKAVVFNDDINNYDMQLAKYFGMPGTTVHCMNLPVSATGCPFSVVANNDTKEIVMRPSDISLKALTRIVKFLELCPNGEHMHWIQLIFMFAQVAAGIDNIAKGRHEELLKHVHYYMEQRTQEGKFINKSVYALRNSLFDIVELQNANNPYGNPMFLSECSFFGCHPVLDPQCFRQTKSQDAAKDKDRLMEYVSKFQANKDLQICLMTAVNLSSTVPDPPAVPYINYTNLLHVYRLLAFRYAEDSVNSIIQQAIHPANQDTPQQDVQPGDVYNPAALDAATGPVLTRLVSKALQDVVSEIQNALPMAVSLEEALGRIKSIEINIANGRSPSIQDLKKVIDLITFYNNSSLIGNLSFVDSLQKRASDGVCDVSRRSKDDALYSIDIPSLCGSRIINDQSTKSLRIVKSVTGPTYYPENIKKYIESNE